MKRQLLHEHHARQDKARKTDYRDEMAFDSTARSIRSDGTSLREELACKAKLIDRYQHGTYWLGCYHISPQWSLQDFAKRNGVAEDLPQTRKAYATLTRAAKHDFEAIRDAIRGGRVTWGYDHGGNWVPSVSYSARLISDDVHPRHAA